MVSKRGISKGLILAMFLYSGVGKVLKPDPDTLRLNKKLGLNLDKFIMVAIGVFEIVASILAFQGQTQSTNLLAVFTVLATLVFYSAPLKPIQLLSNAATLGGLLLLTTPSS